MFLKRRLAALAAVVAALAVTAPVASANAQVLPVTGPVSAGCPLWYGISNPATGCEPYWVLELRYLTAPASFWLG